MIPHKWDIVELQIEPHVGYEIGGHSQLSKNQLKKMSAVALIRYYHNERRPVIVLSNHYFNQAGVLECMPIMSNNHLSKELGAQLISLKGHTMRHNVHGFIVPLQVLGYDYINRKGVLIDHVDNLVKQRIRRVFHDIFMDED